ncbi:aminoglycoside 6-adenylyltransferase [Phyllobacterium myrsinacearum]|uniref:aminoglycoside 6-adenylyltransferase n=1 Tax=Phyllobacterium myrsinacearum TaxID=28101 RepID=UPI000D9A302D|nr:aminoglycoside 6-adenylyltransferase [Phyllobacterium myrsinacearum]PWV88331.1 streptomycin adenylyltransferase [Phyllobacterium myrsinacearum]RZU97622.1 streptomycin adenylyltransferase [Phyllobacterium myrsinacearum]
MWQEQFIEKIRNVFEPNERVIALFLAGSFGKGQADAYTDVDLLAIVARDDQAEFSAGWRHQLETIAPVVFWNELGKEERVFNAITDQWQRVDLAVADAESLKKRSRDALKPLIDRQGLYDALPATVPWTGPNKGYVAYLINEFFRVFGLLAVASGRREYLLSMAGVELLRMMLFNLLSEEVERSDKGGMLAWSRRLSPEQLGLLASIPPLEPTPQSLIDAHLACAKAFLPRARKMAERWNIEWPQAFEEATWNNLEREVGLIKPDGLS